MWKTPHRKRLSQKGEKMKKTHFFSILMFMTVLLAACAPHTATAIKGKWSSDAGNGTVEYADNNVFRVVTPNGESFEGTYSFTDANTVQVAVPPEWGGTYSFDVSVSGDTLTVSVPDQGSTTFTRVK
jgi:uncharacterized protein (DUF2147 family)